MDLQKRRKQSSTMELVVDDVVEQILERLPIKSLLRFKSVSKQWKSTIESPFFQHKHLIHHRQELKTPDLLMINTAYKYNDSKDYVQMLESIMTLELKSSISRNIPIPWENNLYLFCQNSIDGLVCIYNEYDSGIIFNPTTRWYRTLPLSTYQQRTRPNPRWRDCTPLGFGKDQINGLYKPVWLYNSSELGENNNATTTTCEVFDFKINAWRFVEPSCPKRIRGRDDPVYAKGLLYWLTEEEEMLMGNEEIRSVLSFDLHTETFEIVCKTPVSDMRIFNLDDNLWGWNYFDVGHVIWSWNLEEKTWKKIYFIDLYEICTYDDKGDCRCVARPLVFVEEKKKKLILCDYDCCWDLEIRQVLLCESHGPETHSTLFRPVVPKRGCKRTLCYFQSLISIL